MGCMGGGKVASAGSFAGETAALGVWVHRLASRQSCWGGGRAAARFPHFLPP